MGQTETIRVKWEVDVEVPIGTIDREVAQQVAEQYFQDRIFKGEPETACVFTVGDTQVDLSDRTSPALELARAAEKVLKELDDMSGDMIPDMDRMSSVIALRRLINSAGETA